jgi:hypothetical protein
MFRGQGPYGSKATSPDIQSVICLLVIRQGADEGVCRPGKADLLLLRNKQQRQDVSQMTSILTHKEKNRGPQGLRASGVVPGC